MTFNPISLRPAPQYTEPQLIVPGGTAFNYVSATGNGRRLPAVGNYPSGAPGGLSARLGDASTPPLSPFWAAVALIGGSAALWWLSAVSKGGRGRG